MNRLEERLREINQLFAHGIELNDKKTFEALKKEKEEILKALKEHGDI